MKEIVTVILILSELAVVGQAQLILTSSTGLLELSGEQCPGTLTLACDAVNFGTSGLIEWYVEDIRLARFDINTNTISTSPDIMNTTVRIMSSSRINNQFNFTNFSLSVGIEELIPFQGRNISCGSLTERSENFELNNFSIIKEMSEANWNVSYLANYTGTEGKLMEIQVQWNEMVFRCQKISYRIEVSSNAGSVDESRSNILCSNQLCSEKFGFPSGVTSDIIVTVSAGDFVSTSITIANATGHKINFDICGDELMVECSKNAQKECTVLLDGTEVTILPNSSQLIQPFMGEEINITTKNEFSTLQQTIKIMRSNTDSRSEVVVGVGVTCFIIGVFFTIGAIVISILARFELVKIGIQQQRCNKLIVPMVLSVLFGFITLMLWIISALTYDQDSCTNQDIMDALQITALVLSILMVMISVILFAIVGILVEQTKKTGEYEIPTIIEESIPNFTLIIPEFIDCETCHICTTPLGTKKLKERPCGVCGKRICRKCNSQSIKILYHSETYCASKECMEKYLENNEKLKNLSMPIGEISSKWKNEYCKFPCALCKDSKEATFLCNLCGENLCSKDENHFKKIKSKDKNILGEQISENSHPAHATPDTEVTKGQENTGELKSTLVPLIALKKGDLVCNICYTLYKRKQQANVAATSV